MYRLLEIFVVTRDSSEHCKSLMQYSSVLVICSFEIVTLECTWKVGWLRLVQDLHQIYRETYDKPCSRTHFDTGTRIKCPLCSAKDPDLNGLFLADNFIGRSVFCTPHCLSTIVYFQHQRFYNFYGQCIAECVCSSSSVYSYRVIQWVPYSSLYSVNLVHNMNCGSNIINILNSRTMERQHILLCLLNIGLNVGMFLNSWYIWQSSGCSQNRKLFLQIVGFCVIPCWAWMKWPIFLNWFDNSAC